MLPVFTIGHSTRTIPEFVELLRAGEVRLVVDVRRIPRVADQPAIQLRCPGGRLADHHIGYVRIAELGGLRKNSLLAANVNAFWENRSFHNYADYAHSCEFRLGLERLLRASADQRTAIMCAEAVWWQCHRRIIADYLIVAGRLVYHLMGSREVTPATMTRAAVPAKQGLRHPA